MPVTVEESNDLTQLRNEAEARLKAGSARTGSHWSLGVDALNLLHRLSSNPDSAEDALKLLHELQVHQVELDLQNEEIAGNEQVLVEDLSLYREMHDFAPLPYFLVDFEGRIIQGNLAAAELFDVERDSLEGKQLDSFLKKDSRLRVTELLQRVAKSATRDSCLAETDRGGESMHFMASMPEGREHILLACCPCISAE